MMSEQETHSKENLNRARNSYLEYGLSYSAASTFKQCPKRWALEKVEKRDTGDGGNAAIVGFTVHAALEALLSEEPEKRTYEAAKEFIFDLCDKRSELRNHSAKTSQRFKNACLEKINTYFEVCNPEKVDVIDVEQRVCVNFGGIKFNGIIDLVYSDNDKVVVADYKTGSKKIERFSTGHKQQILLYAAAYQEVNNTPCHTASVIYLGEASGERNYQVTERSVSDAVNGLLEVFNDIEQSVEADSFPAQTSPLCYWCPFLLECEPGIAAATKKYGSLPPAP